MKAKQASMLTGQVIRHGLSYLLRGGMYIKNGHLPPSNHHIPDDFFGICVASSPDPAMDEYVIAQLKALGIKQVRLDFTYGDLEGFNARFLNALDNANFEVTLHLVQPFASAKNMQSATEKVIWRDFLQSVLDVFGSRIKQVEIGTTINRKRWAGYSSEGFLCAWEIAHTAIKARNIVLLGPNVQDFEPFYNISFLKVLKQNGQLPDIHSNNLFAERTVEPERFDHRIFKYQWTTCFKYNLIKKSRILQKIGQDFGVPQLVSSVAFWAIFRIRRQLPDTAQKQADYVTRYFNLIAASGSFTQTNWGALICAREGLIDNGLVEADYPALEQVAHYPRANGVLKNYCHYPSFNAFKTVVSMLQGAQYKQAISTTAGLEIHHFLQTDKTFHVAWTINGKLAFLQDIYDVKTLANMTIHHRDGHVLNLSQVIITESPIYLCWPIDLVPQTIALPILTKNLVIHAHIQGKQYFRYLQNGWDGLILASNKAEADLIVEKTQPETLLKPDREEALRHARNAIWAVADPRNSNLGNAETKLTIKQPVKMYPHKAFLDRFKPSKAKRSWNGAMELMRRGVGTAQPVAYFEKIGDTTLKQNFYICEFVKADANIGQIFSAYSKGEYGYLGLNPELVYTQLAQYCHTMHSRGIHFRDLSGGNILVNIAKDIRMHNALSFSLIDTARIHAHNHGIRFSSRIADLTRACHKLNWAGRERFMQIYLGLSGKQFTWQTRLQFQLYDIKVSLKRTIGRKGIKRLIKRLKGQA